jgi:hypothetical protein
MAGESEYFKVLIKGKVHDRTSDGKTSERTAEIVAELPDDIAASIEQEWENPFKLETGSTIQGAVQLFSRKLKNAGILQKELSLNFNHDALFVHMGGTPFSMTLDLEFVAESNIRNEIVKPVQDLIKLSVPWSTEDGKKILQVPPDVTIKVGKFLYLSPAIITAVNPQFTRPLVGGNDGDFQGAPIRMPVSINIQTKRVMTQNRVAQVFFNG